MKILTGRDQLTPTPTTGHKPPNTRKLTAINYHATTGPEALRATVALIGKGIRAGGRYVPLVQYARRLASTAPPKNYLGQLRAVFNDVVKRWRYVHDPSAVEMVTISGPEIYGQILGADFRPPYHGYGDCDDSTILLGALAEGLGLKTRVVTISPPSITGFNKLFSHVYPEVLIPRVGWVAADLVGFPAHGLGWAPPAIRRAVWDTYGNLISYSGFYPERFKNELRQMTAADVRGVAGLNGPGGEHMGSLHGYDPSQFGDYGLENFGFAGLDETEPADWSKYGVLNFGAYVDRPLPMVEGDQLGLFAEYDEDDFIGFAGGAPIIRTKMFEMDPREVAYIYRTGRPRLGAVALGDDGDVYQWTEVPGLGGFFKKLFKKAKKAVKKIGKGVRKVAKGIRGRARKLIKKLPGGKYVVKVAGKLRKVGLKAAKAIAKAGRFLAPVAAMIPGYGPVIAAALAKGPKILKIAEKLGIGTDSKGRPKFKSAAEKRRFKRELKKEAEKLKRRAGRAKGGRARRAARAMGARAIRKGSPAWAAKMRGYGLDYADLN